MFWSSVLVVLPIVGCGVKVIIHLALVVVVDDKVNGLGFMSKLCRFSAAAVSLVIVVNHLGFLPLGIFCIL